MTIERRFDIPLIASLALKEKQIQQNYRPIIAVHKWFARRPGTLFRGLLLSEFADGNLVDSYFSSHDFAGKQVADPFMGGGTPLIEANRIGCDIHGFDINPMAAWIVREEIERLDHKAYRREADELISNLDKSIGESYRTDCPVTGDQNLPVKYFLWVKTVSCIDCGTSIDLFPGYLIADNTRHPKNVLICSKCGELNEVDNLEALGTCSHCQAYLQIEGPAKRNKCACANCGAVAKYPRANDGPPSHRLFALEYVNPARKREYTGRLFKKPSAKDLARLKEVERRWQGLEKQFVPNERILPGDESDRLHRWGYQRYCDLFNSRQLLGLELSCQLIVAQKDPRIKQALATNFSDLLRYQNMLCRYDTMALKSLDIFSVHGFPVGLVQCESNLLGILSPKGTNIGSGGWTNIIEKYVKAKQYCDAPFEVKHQGANRVQIPIANEWIGETKSGMRSRKVSIRCTSSTTVALTPASLDAVFTDPPYFGNVQYAELMDFCFAWLRRVVGVDHEGFGRSSTRDKDELTVNMTEGRDAAHFTEGIANVFSAMAKALKPGAPLAFTYHHNKVDAYLPIGVAILDSGLTCSASLPCPAEMGGSIHIHGTGSSIIDTIFVSRLNGETDRKLLFASTNELVHIVAREVDQLRLAGVKPSAGDIRCISYGHMTRMAIWNLRPTWDASTPTREKLEKFAGAVRALGSVQIVIDTLIAMPQSKVTYSNHGLPLFHKEDRDAVAF